MSSDIEVTSFLEHYGVQGMKWGQRKAANAANVQRLKGKGLSNRQAKNTNRAQNQIDVRKMAATGRNGKASVLKQMNNRSTANMTLSLGSVLKHPLSTSKANRHELKKSEGIQKDIANGDRKVRAKLLEIGGVSIANLDYSL